MLDKVQTAVRLWREEGFRRVLDGTYQFLFPSRLFAVGTATRYQLRYGLSRTNATAVALHPERDIMVDFLDNLTADDVFYDVGAHRGAYALKALDILPPEQIVAIEPGPVIDHFKATLPDDSALEVIEKAVSAGGSEEHDFSLKGDYQITKGGHSDKEGESTTVESIDGEDILASDLPLPTVIKMDVNGWDLDALEALRPVIERDECRLVYIEIEPPDANNTHRHPSLHKLDEEEVRTYFDSNWSFDEILLLLVQSGFKVEYMMDYYDDLFIKAYK